MEYYIAQFNVGEENITAVINLFFIGIEGKVSATELWTDTTGTISENGELVSEVEPHGVRLYKVELK